MQVPPQSSTASAFHLSHGRIIHSSSHNKAGCGGNDCSLSFGGGGQNEREGLENGDQGHKVRFELNPDRQTTDGNKSQAMTTKEKRIPVIARSYADVARKSTRKVAVVLKSVQPMLLTL
jgi:hypothetical protein